MGHSRGPPWGAFAFAPVLPGGFLFFFCGFVCAHLFLRILALEQLRLNVVLLCIVLHSRFRSFVVVLASLSLGATYQFLNV